MSNPCPDATTRDHRGCAVCNAHAEQRATREAHYQAGRRRGHQDAVEALSTLVVEDLCRCINCLSEALEALP